VEGDEDVLRAHVAVDDVPLLAARIGELVSVVQPLRRTVDHLDRVGPWQGPVPVGQTRHDPPEVTPFEELHGDVVLVAADAEIVDLDHVGVIELRREARLVEEHTDEFFVRGQVRQDPLDRHEPIEPGTVQLPGEEDLSHAACGELLDQLVVAELDGLHFRPDLPYGRGRTAAHTYASLVAPPTLDAGGHGEADALDSRGIIPGRRSRTTFRYL